jgi:pimeloyl-ACP methyl ester carboxylesterase
MQTVESADGTTLAYDRHGDGPPVICLHGTAVRRTMWLPLSGSLEDASLLAPDRRGRGDSGDGPAYDFQREIDDVVALAATCQEDPILFGHSFGGLLAIAAASSVDIAGLALYEPPVPRLVYDIDEMRDEDSVAAQTAEYIEAGDPESAARCFFRETTGAESVEHLPIWPECIEFAHTIPRECRVVENFDATDVAVDPPTLLLTGTRSNEYLQDGVGALAELLPESRVAEVDGAGHAGVATAPAAVADELQSFLTSL